MTIEANIAEGCLIPPSARIEVGATVGARVVLTGDNIVVRENARVDTAAVIGEGVTVGQGAWVRAGPVRVENEHAAASYIRLGMTKIRRTAQDIFFEYSRVRFRADCDESLAIVSQSAH